MRRLQTAVAFAGDVSAVDGSLQIENAESDVKCPKCDIPLVMSERQGVEIDYCSQCRGVWLDRGELDKIIERSSRVEFDDDDDDHRRRQVAPPPYNPDQHRGYEHDYRYKKKKSFWSELFD